MAVGLRVPLRQQDDGAARACTGCFVSYVFSLTRDGRKELRVRRVIDGRKGFNRARPRQAVLGVKFVIADGRQVEIVVAVFDGVCRVPIEKRGGRCVFALRGGHRVLDKLRDK